MVLTNTLQDSQALMYRLSLRAFVPPSSASSPFAVDVDSGRLAVVMAPIVVGGLFGDVSKAVDSGSVEEFAVRWDDCSLHVFEQLDTVSVNVLLPRVPGTRSAAASSTSVFASALRPSRSRVAVFHTHSHTRLYVEYLVLSHCLSNVLCSSVASSTSVFPAPFGLPEPCFTRTVTPARTFNSFCRTFSSLCYLTIFRMLDTYVEEASAFGRRC
jgi:hypothetical protein